MFISVFDVFKIGIGPSSSHTMGPMSAAATFLDELNNRFEQSPNSVRPSRFKVSLHGSLAYTGKGHATDRAVILGLMGYTPESLNPETIDQLELDTRKKKKVNIPSLGVFNFDPDVDLVFDFGDPLPGHANGIIFSAIFDDQREYFTETYYSIGGGFVVTADALQLIKGSKKSPLKEHAKTVNYPFPFSTAAEMLEMGKASNLDVADMKRANELTHMSSEELDEKILNIWSVMEACIDRGLEIEGSLPGGLNVKRRACAIHKQLLIEQGKVLSQSFGSLGIQGYG